MAPPESDFTVKKQSKPVEEAQKALLKLYERKKSQSAELVEFGNFYPIDLPSIVSALGWSIERTTDPSYLGGIEPAKREEVGFGTLTKRKEPYQNRRSCASPHSATRF
jgi:hypothetical protein